MTPQGQTVGYVRVSTSEQNSARQLDAIGAVDRLFEDQVSGRSRSNRPGLADCLSYVRDGDSVRVSSMDRLARSLTDLQGIVDDFLAKGASVCFIKENQTYSPTNGESMSRLLLQILGAFAEFERNLIRERQAEGIRIAQAAGKYQGRKASLSLDQLQSASDRIAIGVPKAQVARELGVDRTTLYRALRRLPAK